MKVLVIIPAYNEENSIEYTVEQLRAVCPELDYVVVDDGSTDHSAAICAQRGYPTLRLPVNLGIGGAMQTGYRCALAGEYDAVVQMDADGQHDAAFLRELLAPLEADEADMVIGSRYLEKQGFQSSALRRFGIRFLSGLIRLLGGVRVRDVTSGMRAMNRKAFGLFAGNYAQDYPEPEAVLAAGLAGLRITEVPVRMRERHSGQSSIGAFQSLYYMIKVSLALLIARMTRGRETRAQ